MIRGYHAAYKHKIIYFIPLNIHLIQRNYVGHFIAFHRKQFADHGEFYSIRVFRHAIACCTVNRLKETCKYILDFIYLKWQ